MALRVLPIIAVLAMTAVAGAQNNTPGAKLWAEARALAKDGKYAEACVKYQQSMDLEPTFGVVAGLADCQENLGHLALAWRLFNQAADEAASSDPKNAEWAHGRADSLRARLGVIVLHLSAEDIGSASVSIGGRELKSAADVTEVVEPGEVVVVVSKPGKTPYRAKKKLLAGATLDVNVPQLQASTEDPNDVHDDNGPPAEVSHRRRSRVLLAYGVGGAGLLAGATGIIIGFKANSDYDAQFGAGKCSQSPDGPMCATAESKQGLLDAVHLGKVGTGFGIASGVLIAAGAVLWFTAPKDMVVTPTASESSAGISLVGRF